MGLIPEEHKQHIMEELNEKLTGAVQLIMFTQETECSFCKQARELVEEIGGFSDKINVVIYDFVKDKDKAYAYKVDRVPAIIIKGEKDYGIRFYGLPFGYELQTFLESMINVSSKDSRLPEEVKTKIKAIDRPVHIQVFVTLTCPYCPIVAGFAYKFAMENDFVTADVVDISEFPHLGYKYGVMGVPKTVINEKVEFLGAVPEDVFLEYVLSAIR